MPTKTRFVGNWEFIGTLGQGGFGQVQHWRNNITNQEIATKLLKNVENLSEDQLHKLHTRWQKEYNWTRELRNVSSIVAGVDLTADHADFVNYLNNSHMCNLPVIILEYCNGGDVRSLLQRPENANGVIEFEVRAILSSLREALHFLHMHCKLCHRDLKPENIVIHNSNKRKLYKITDFGLARNAPHKTMIQSVVGTRHYYAPEVVDTGKYNMKVDYWSMGVIAYELICGMLPFIPHQTLLNIIVNIRKKPRNCIAIIEHPAQVDQFQFETSLAAVNHLSEPWSKEITKWLTLALDKDHSRRGATDEVQCEEPAIFTEMDRLLQIKVLTLFAVCTYKRLEYVVTPNMTMKELHGLIIKDIKENQEQAEPIVHIVLPTGHPHKHVSFKTTPIDLYVADWCDTSQSSGNPPVMVYVINITSKCTLTSPTPCLPPMLQYCLDSKDIDPPIWVKERMSLDLHYMLCREQEIVRTQLHGFKEYTLTLEHEILGYQSLIKELDMEKNKCCGAMELFQRLFNIAQEQRIIHLDNNLELQLIQLTNQYDETVKSTNKIINHYESSLRCVRDRSINDSKKLYDTIIKADIFNIAKFRKECMLPYGKLSCSTLNDWTIQFARARNAIVHDDRIISLHKSVNQTHARFFKIYNSALPAASQSLKYIKDQLLQLQLQLLKKSAEFQQQSVNQLYNAMSHLTVNPAILELASGSNDFDSQSIHNTISEAERLLDLMQSDMEVDRF